MSNDNIEGEQTMPKITIELAQPILDRLNQIAVEKSVGVEAVVRHFVTCGIDIYDAPDCPDPETFKPPTRPEKFDNSKVKAFQAELAEWKLPAALGRASERQEP